MGLPSTHKHICWIWQLNFYNTSQSHEDKKDNNGHDYWCCPTPAINTPIKS